MTLPTQIGLTPDLLVQLFPFHFVFNRQLEVVQFGKLLPKICLILFDTYALNFIGFSISIKSQILI